MKKLFLFCFVFAARGVVLEWDAVTTHEDGTPADNVAGYRAYYGTRSREYSTVVDVGNFTAVTLPTLPTLPGTTFYAVTAYDTGGFENEFSDEVSYTASALSRSFVWRLPAGRLLIENTFGLLFPITWLPLEEIDGPLDYTITVDTTVPEKYFRVRLIP